MNDQAARILCQCLDEGGSIESCEFVTNDSGIVSDVRLLLNIDHLTIGLCLPTRGNT
jgi:hypothetical protein